MDETSQAGERGRRVLQAFKTIAADYDDLIFPRDSARRLVELAGLAEGAAVLDLATGTGACAFMAEAQVGPGGRVVGVDFSPEMLSLARAKAAPLGSAAAFVRGDAALLSLAEGSFDAVLCASSLFFVPDPAAAARECLRVLKPGGSFLFNSFGERLLQPVYDLWRDRLSAYGIAAPSAPTRGLNTPAACEALLREAGFERPAAWVEDLSFTLLTPQDRWRQIEAGLEILPLRQVSPEQREAIRSAHLAELAARIPPQGLRVEVPAIFARGTAPAGFPT